MIRKLFTGATPIIALFVLLLASLYLMSEATHNSKLFGKSYSWLLGINVLTIGLFIILIGKSVWLLILQYRNKVTGSRLTTKLVLLFVLLSVTPVSVVYYFSLDFIKRGIDSWFDVRVENALTDALELSKASLGVRMSQVLNETREMADSLATTDNSMAVLALNDLRNQTDASELALFSLNGRIIAASSAETETLLPNRLENRTQLLLRIAESDVGLYPSKDSGLHIHVAVRVPDRQADGSGRILQAFYPIPERISNLAESVQSAFGRYREIAYLRIPLKYSFILTLSLVLLSTILLAIWGAFFAARRMVSPITDLVDGTRAVAAGDYAKRLPLPGHDELGFLVRSFNEMTHRIAMAQHQAKTSQKQLEAQHAYLEAVLTGLTSGVITLDAGYCLYTSNPAASQILNVPLERYTGRSMDDIAGDNSPLQGLADAVYKHIENDHPEWQEEVTLFTPGGRQVLMCRGSRLPESGENPGGRLLVFDDITSQLQAQRNAAWGEVARRLAHEIKNPLTPIQLSAERLRHKYLKKMPAEDARVLDRATHTIVQQVENLKEMVKAFSDYARMPTLQMTEVDINKLIREVMDLYRGSRSSIEFSLRLDPDTPHIEADIGRLRQVMHNLIKNAMEALPDERGRVTINTHCAEEQACHFVELSITDTGPGFPEDLAGQIFEPYITSKPKGSGLGLAIVKKIIEEHGGMLWAQNSESGGAMIVIRLPVTRVNKLSPTQEKSNLPNDDENAAA